MPSKNKIIRTTKSFDKSFQKIPKTVQDKTTKVLEIFYHDPVAPLLHNHALTGEWRGFRSINITGDYRLIFCEISEGIYEVVELVQIGTHSQLYG